MSNSTGLISHPSNLWTMNLQVLIYRTVYMHIIICYLLFLGEM